MSICNWNLFSLLKTMTADGCKWCISSLLHFFKAHALSFIVIRTKIYDACFSYIITVLTFRHLLFFFHRVQSSGFVADVDARPQVSQLQYPILCLDQVHVVELYQLARCQVRLRKRKATAISKCSSQGCPHWQRIRPSRSRWAQAPPTAQTPLRPGRSRALCLGELWCFWPQRGCEPFSHMGL